MDYTVLDKELKQINHEYKEFERRVEKECTIEIFYKNAFPEEDGVSDENKFSSDNNALLYRYKKRTSKWKIAEILVIPIILTVFLTVLTGSMGYIYNICSELTTQSQEMVATGQAQFDKILQQADPTSREYSAMKEVADSTMKEMNRGNALVRNLNILIMVLVIVMAFGLVSIVIQFYNLFQGSRGHDEFEIALLEKYIESRKQLYLKIHPRTEQQPT